jgi:hypothetical protein
MKIFKANYDKWDEHTSLAWEKLKKKYDQVSAPSLDKTERMFRNSKLSKG